LSPKPLEPRRPPPTRHTGQLKEGRELKPKTIRILGKIISGGQTGVDRAALDVALELGIPCGGWCPKGRLAEDGHIDKRYPLVETRSPEYQVRTERNVKESDGTLVLSWGQPIGGTALALKFALKCKKPFLGLDLSGDADEEIVLNWAKANKIGVLNVAGLRESQFPGIHDRAIWFLRKVLKRGKRSPQGENKDQTDRRLRVGCPCRRGLDLVYQVPGSVPESKRFGEAHGRGGKTRGGRAARALYDYNRLPEEHRPARRRSLS
jgi:hypothetical protein